MSIKTRAVVAGTLRTAQGRASPRRAARRCASPRDSRPARDPIVEGNDPVYRIAYDVDRRKVGCVLIQAARGCDVPQVLFFNYFGCVDAWTIHAGNCQIYPIRQSQLPLLATRTDFDRGKVDE